MLCGHKKRNAQEKNESRTVTKSHIHWINRNKATVRKNNTYFVGELFPVLNSWSNNSVWSIAFGPMLRCKSFSRKQKSDHIMDNGQVSISRSNKITTENSIIFFGVQTWGSHDVWIAYYICFNLDVEQRVMHNFIANKNGFQTSLCVAHPFRKHILFSSNVCITIQAPKVIIHQSVSQPICRSFNQFQNIKTIDDSAIFFPSLFVICCTEKRAVATKRIWFNKKNERI